MKLKHYILKNKRVYEADLLTWARWLDDHRKDRRVAKTKVGRKEVSTVFIGLDHNFHGKRLHIFETMIFPDGDTYERYATWGEAKKGHDRAVKSLKK